MVVTASAAAAFVSRMRTARGASEHTVRAYASDLRNYRAFLAARALCPREESTILAYSDYLAREKAAAPRTLRRRMACLRGFYGELVRSGAIERSPFTGLSMQLPRARSLPRTLSRADTRRLAARAWTMCEADCERSMAAGAATLLLIAVGLRVAELVALRPQDYDLGSAALHVRGKGRRERRVFVVDERLARVIARLAARPRASFIFSPGEGGWSTQAARRVVREAAEEAGIEPRVTPHMLRHTCATLLLEDGVDIRYLQRLLGHENIATTAIYAHVGDAALQKALASAGLLAALGGGG